MKTKKIAVAQVCSNEHKEKNLEVALALVNQAYENGASLVAFPECFLYLGSDQKAYEVAESTTGPLVEIFRKEAREKKIAILMGSIPEKIPGNEQQVYNSSVFIDEEGEVKAIYRKIHLFDLELPDLKLKESEFYKAGEEIVTLDHSLGKLGFSICYDLRFPSLFQKLASSGVKIIFLPAAFTLQTGKDHWIPLLQARAIENQVYLVAPAQFGQHNSKRISYGSSVIIDPWGTIMARAPERECLIYAELDMDFLDSVRTRMPVLSHRVSELD